MKWALFPVLILAGLVVFGPYEPVETSASFEPRKFGEGVQVYFESIEADVPNLRPGSEKRIIWHGQQETRTPVSVVYLHGFSASSEEIRPVPDRVAEALGANLVYTRFKGHGRDSDAMAEGSVTAWMQDAAEALAAGRATGEQVIVIATSTGGTVAALAALDPDLSENVAGMAFVSPNFGINNTMAPLLTWPAARYWLPLVAGQRRSFEPANEAQAKHWTTEYPSVAVFPMAAMVKHAVRQDYSGVDIPVLFYYSPKDTVVDPAATDQVRVEWGGVVTHLTPTETGEVSPYHHVVAGDIISPGNTAEASDAIISWARSLQ